MAWDPYLGESMIFAGTYCVDTWAIADGTLLPIAQNSAYAQLVGTTYGGDGVTTVGLPNLSGATPVGSGFGPSPLQAIQGVAVGLVNGASGTTITALNLTQQISIAGTYPASS